VKRPGCIAVLLVGLFPWSPAPAHVLRNRGALDAVNRQLQGQVVDHTNNHGTDRRIWSPSLGQKRDLYVYLPPGFDPHLRYPFLLWLHGFAQDESSFLNDIAEPLDRAIAAGKLPPMIVAAPDGSLTGRDCLFSPGSFFLNTKAGAFEDFLMVDVWNFLMSHYPIRPEPEAHVIAGTSMGGGAAFNKAFKYPDRFRSVLGVFPPVNTRWEDCHGRYRAPFDPCCWGWRTDFSRKHEVMGRFYGIITIRQRAFTNPLFGRRLPPGTVDEISRNNPIEMLDLYDVQPGVPEMFIAYAGKDQFFIDAQVESFLYVTRERGLKVEVAYDPRGKHDRATALKFLPRIVDWLAARLGPYGPCGK
jgi:S-formylglutathione hydrolase FrmB